MYLHGHAHTMKKSPSDAILSILNFDYCMETILKTVLLDAKGSFPKYFEELIKEITGQYASIGYTSEALSLHKLRNDVQHHGQIPSQHEVDRHSITVRSFFDEVCLKAYDGKITFADISLALFVSSEVERIILDEMEKAHNKGRFSDSVYFAKAAVAYHGELLRHAMKVPHTWHSIYLRSNLKGRGLDDIGQFVEDTDNKIDWIVDRLTLREYYDDITDFIGSEFRYGLSFKTLERKMANQDDSEKARSITYDFIIGTQDMIREPDLKYPEIFDLSILEKHDDEAVIQIGLATVRKLAEAKLTLTEGDVEKSVQSISTQTGLQIVNLKGLTKGAEYRLSVDLRTENDERNTEDLHFEM
jgi:hypothetical protein